MLPFWTFCGTFGTNWAKLLQQNYEQIKKFPLFSTEMFWKFYYQQKSHRHIHKRTIFFQYLVYQASFCSTFIPYPKNKWTLNLLRWPYSFQKLFLAIFSKMQTIIGIFKWKNWHSLNFNFRDPFVGPVSLHLYESILEKWFLLNES